MVRQFLKSLPLQTESPCPPIINEVTDSMTGGKNVLKEPILSDEFTIYKDTDSVESRYGVDDDAHIVCNEFLPVSLYSAYAWPGGKWFHATCGAVCFLCILTRNGVQFNGGAVHHRGLSSR